MILSYYFSRFSQIFSTLSNTSRILRISLHNFDHANCKDWKRWSSLLSKINLCKRNVCVYVKKEKLLPRNATIFLLIRCVLIWIVTYFQKISLHLSSFLHTSMIRKLSQFSYIFLYVSRIFASRIFFSHFLLVCFSNFSVSSCCCIGCSCSANNNNCSRNYRKNQKTCLPKAFCFLLKEIWI